MLFAPVCLLGYLGATYVVECLDVLVAPGVPIALTYKAAAGRDVSLTADSYTFDWRRGTAWLQRPRLVGSDGSVVAQLKSVQVSGINIFWGADQVVQVRAVDLDARLVRLPSGKLEIQELLPKQSGEPSKVPYSLTLNQARVLVVDRITKQEWRQPVLVTSIQVDGLGDDWLATAGAYIPSIGRVTARLQGMKAGLSLRGETDNLSLKPLLDHFRTTPEAKSQADLAKTRIGSLIVRGPVELFLPSGKDAVLEARVTAAARSISYDHYQLDSAVFDGLVTADGATGSIRGRVGEVSGTFDGGIGWRGGVAIGGRATADAPTVAALPRWIRNVLPSPVKFERGHYDGWVAMNGGKASADGELRATTAGYGTDTLDRPTAIVHVDDNRAVVRLVAGTYLGQRAPVAVAYDFASKGLSGALGTTHLPLRLLSKRVPQLRGLDGSAVVTASLRGNAAKPIVDFLVSGAGSFARPNRPTLHANRIDIAGTYQDGTVAVIRGIVDGPDGLVVAKGSVRSGGSIEMDVVGRALNLATGDKRLGGTANVVATVRGTFQAPLVQGRAEAYDSSFNGQTITAASADLRATRSLARLENVNVYRGAAHARGVGQIVFSSGRLNARLSAANVQVEDFLGEGYGGSIDARDVVVVGTVDHPIVNGTATMRDAVAHGVKIDEATVTAGLDGRQLVLKDAVAKLSGGTVAVTGTYDIDAKAGHFAAEAKDLDVNRLAVGAARYATIAGTLSGRVAADINKSGLEKVSGTGDLSDVLVNKTPIGSGPWTVGFADGKVNGNLDVGQLDRYVSFSDLSYNLNSKEVGGRLDVYKFKLQDLIGTALPSLPNLSYDVVQKLHDIDGVVNIGTQFSGTTDALAVDANSIQVTDLVYRDVPFGTLDASLSAADRKWKLNSLTLAGGPGSIRASGSVDERGDVSLTGDLTKLDLAKLAVIEPRLAGVGGTMDVSFEASGPTKSPLVHASLTAERLFAATATTPDDQTLRVMLDTISLSETVNGKGGIGVTGDYFYRGFQGTISANAPLKYPFEIGGDGKVQAKVTLAKRSLAEIASFVPSLDPAQTTGWVDGEVTGTGTLQDFTVSGGVKLHADQIVGRGASDLIKSVDTRLTNVDAAITLGDNKAQATLTADSSRGGSMALNVASSTDDLRRLADTLQSGALNSLRNNAVAGSLSFNKFHVRQAFAGNTYADATLDGAVTLDGTVRRPKLSGSLLASNLDSVIPLLQTGSEAGEPPAINPTFDLTFALANRARIRTSTADLTVLGSGTLQGTLAQPALDGTMTVEKGSIRLPAATIRIEQGGSLALNYKTTGTESIANLTVDLEGRTNVTSVGMQGYPERYAISISLTGDLLKENGLNLIASSDPPDLSQDRILMLLGQLDLLSSFGTSGSKDTSEKLRGTLAGIAVPTLLDPFTSRVASALKLEYLTVEYNQYEQTSLVFSKSLSSEIYITGSRQISPPLPGYAQPYDIRLVYRPRRGPDVLRRVGFSVGADQDRPWKVAMEYGIRF